MASPTRFVDLHQSGASARQKAQKGPGPFLGSGGLSGPVAQSSASLAITLAM